MHFRLTRNDGHDIAFALLCLGYRSIHFSEFKDWIFHVIEHADDPPPYLFDMLDVQTLRDFKPSGLMGWHDEAGISDEEADALRGISFLRNITSHEDTISKAAALATLQANGAFFERVKRFFPFLDLETVAGPDPDKGW